MNKFTIEINVENGKADVEFLFNGEKINDLFAVNFLANMRNGDLHILGKKLSKDIENKFYIDEKTKETAEEQIDIMQYLINGNYSEIINQTTKELNDALQNIKDTSTLRANELIIERGV